MFLMIGSREIRDWFVEGERDIGSLQARSLPVEKRSLRRDVIQDARWRSRKQSKRM